MKNPKYDNVGTPFGVATIGLKLKSLRITYWTKPTFSWTLKKDPALLDFEGDSVVRLL